MVVKIFFTGATGYIGGSVLDLLLKFPDKYKITALVRSKEAAEKLKTLNVTPILGSLNDADVLAKAAKEADMVVDTADCDNLNSAKTLLKALSESKTPKIFLHTSGTGVVSDTAAGTKESKDVYSDLDVKRIHALPLTNPHRDVDQYLIDNCGKVKLIIVAPPIIYGLGTGQFNRHSILIPGFLKTFEKLGQVATYNQALNVWSSIHVEDLADFYLLLIEKALEGKADFQKEGFYFPEAGDFQFKPMMVKLRDLIVARKLIQNSEIRQLTPAEVEKHFGPAAWAYGCNSRTRGERCRALGWAPKRGDVFSTLEEEVDALIKKGIIGSKK